MAKLKENELKKIALLEQKTLEMLEKIRVMFHTSLAGLMKNDIKILDQVLKGEEKVTEIYNDLTTSAIDSSRGDVSVKVRKLILDLVDIICAIEKAGDCCVWLVEHIQYKISENLLFSETAVQEYQDLHSKVEQIISDTVEAIRTKDGKLAKRILNKKPGINRLVKTYRANHIDRAAKGICDEWARVRYLDMLDFTGQTAHFCMEIADKLSKK